MNAIIPRTMHPIHGNQIQTKDFQIAQKMHGTKINNERTEVFCWFRKLASKKVSPYLEKLRSEDSMLLAISSCMHK